MAIPQVNIDEVSSGNIGVHCAMTMATHTFDQATIAYFLDQVPERGEQLWGRFRTFQQEKGEDFLEFIRSTVSADPVKLFFPRECTLDPMSRMFLAGEVQKAVASSGIRSNADLLQIYFGEGALYETARAIACRGCANFGCKHKPQSSRNKKHRRW